MSDLAEQVERAFAYRGYVTLARMDGGRVVGYIYSRGPGYVDVLDERGQQRTRIPLAEIARIDLTGDDAAALATAQWERRRGKLESRDTSIWGEWQQNRLLVLGALSAEIPGIEGIATRSIGVGGSAAAAIAAECPRAVISCGFAGGLDASLGAGRIVIATSVSDEVGETIAAPEPLRTRASDALFGLAVPGEIHSTTHIAGTPAHKRALVRPGRVAVDLETAPIARAAQRAGIPWLAMRVIVDPLDVELPQFARMPRADYRAAALRHALGGPRAVIELVRLASRARDARRVLATALRLVVRAIQELEEARP